MKIRMILSLIATIFLSTSVMAKVHSGVEVKIQSVKSNLGNDEDVTLKVTYKNRTNQPISILKWYLPDELGNLEEGIFKVTRDGETVEYLGRHYKRPAPTLGDYVVLKAHQKLAYEVEISGVYDFSDEGYYQIDLSVSNFELFGLSSSGKNNNRNTQLKNDYSVDIYLAKTRAPKGKPCNPKKEDCSGDGGGTADVTFTGACSNSEQTTILSALDQAKNMANDSVSYLNGSVGTRYTTWFGNYSSARWNTVSGNFDSIKDALDNQSKTFDCSCNQSYFAYVYPNQPYKVYLCRAFWSAKLTGTDSKAGTIIHEVSHFNVVAGTDDVVYGQTGAQNLANSDPNSAVQNADSHEYFAENTPNLN